MSRASHPLQPWQVLSEMPLLRADPWFRVTKQTIALPDGRVIDDYYQIRQRDYVEIVVRDDNALILGLWRYKHGPRRVNLGLPAGYLEEGESPQTAAARELREECGLTAASWSSLGAFHLDGNRSEARCHVWLAENCSQVVAMPSDDLEEFRAEWIDMAAWLRHIQTGAVATLAVVTAMALAGAWGMRPDNSLPARPAEPKTGPNAGEIGLLTQGLDSG